MRKSLRVVLVLGLLLVAAVGATAAYGARQQAVDYSDIEAAVAAQRYADTLRDSRPASYDCDNSPQECRALRYYVTADKCDEVVEGLMGVARTANVRCQPTQTDFAFAGHTFGAQLAKLDVGYELIVWNRN